MSDLFDQFIKRLDGSPDKIVASTFCGHRISSRDYLNYIRFNLSDKIFSRPKDIAIICDESLEAILIISALLFSHHNVSILSPALFANLFSNNSRTVDKYDSIIFSPSVDYSLFETISISHSIRLTPLDSLQDADFSPYHILSELGVGHYANTTTTFFSSGSTSIPKEIPLSYSNILSCYINLFSTIPALSSKSIVCFHNPSFVIYLPYLFFFCFLPDSILYAPLASKLKSFGPIFSYIRSCAIIPSPLIISVPSAYRVLLQLKKTIASLKDHSNLSLITCGEPLDLSLAQIIASVDPVFAWNMYGSTEVSPWIMGLDILKYLSTLSNDQPNILPAGSPLQGVKTQFLETNELLVNSKSVFKGYANSDSTSDHFISFDNLPYFRTGDAFEVDEAGFYFCKGRLNSALKIMGMFVNPVLIEASIRSQYKCMDVLVVVSNKSSRLVVLFQSDPALAYCSEDVTLFVKSITSQSIPVVVETISSELVKLRSGKVDRKYYQSKY